MPEYVVAVQCIVYNHEKFISECLDGFVMQKTNFPFVVVVHDDASTDSSRYIIERYAERYPEIIIPFFEKENQYSKGASCLSQAIRRAMESVPSKYMAICEGDDCWTVPDKLQKQVDFLESHPDYSMCFHRAIEHWEDGFKPDSDYCHFEGREYRLEEVFQVLAIPTASAVLRRCIYESVDYKYMFSTANTHFRDNLTWYCCFLNGRVMCMDFIGSIYRRHLSGIAYAVRPITHMRNNFEYYKVMKITDRHLARKQILFDIPQLLLDYPIHSPEIAEIRTVIKHIGLIHTVQACMVYYTKKITRNAISDQLWQKAKKLLKRNS